MIVNYALSLFHILGYDISDAFVSTFLSAQGAPQQKCAVGVRLDIANGDATLPCPGDRNHVTLQMQMLLRFNVFGGNAAGSVGGSARHPSSLSQSLLGKDLLSL